MSILHAGQGILTWHLRQKLPGGIHRAEYFKGTSTTNSVTKAGSIWIANAPDFTFEFNEKANEFRLEVLNKGNWIGNAGFVRKNPEENVLEITWADHLYCSPPSKHWHIWDGTRIILAAPKES